MARVSSSYLGPLGSLVHHFRADARTVTALADLDWTRRFRRVWLDTLREMVVLMSPSFDHEKRTRDLDAIVGGAAQVLNRAAANGGSTRWRGKKEPPRTGLEPDCCFYVGDRALAYRDAVLEGEEAEEAFVERTPPDLVVEVEITHADEGKPTRYADLGVREFWRIHKRKEKPLEVEFQALHPGAEPQPLSASEVLPGLTPEAVCRAIEALRPIVNRDEQTRVVKRIVRRCLQHGFLPSGDLMVREERAPYLTRPVGGEGYSPFSLSAPHRPAVSTSYLGPLGSTIHHLRLDARTITEIAGLDWDTRFRRVWLDPARELVVLMEPSRRHDDLTGAFDDLVETAAKALGRDSVKLGSARWRREGEPPDTGIEADGSFYFGERAEGYRAALAESEQAAVAFAEQSGPDLVVEVEMTRADEGKVARYSELGVRELWRIHTESGPEKGAENGEKAIRADFLSLRRDAAPEPLRASEVLPGLTSEKVGEVVQPVLSRDSDEGPAVANPPAAQRPARRRQALRQRADTVSSGPAPTDAEPVAAAAAVPRNH